MQPDPQQLTCDAAQFFISRALDCDLERGELRQLFGHLGNCAVCQERLTEFAALESQLLSLNQLYEKRAPGESFDAKLHAAISGASGPTETRRPKQSSTGLLTWLGQWAWVKPAAVAGFTGVFAGFLLFTVIAPNNPSQVVAPAQRFFIHPITFQSAEDRQTWGDDVLLPPGQTLRQVVKRGHDAPYHFRIQSQGPVNVVVTHDNPQIKNDPSYRMQGPHGLRYASLQTPRVGDVIVIRNDGTDSVRVNTSAPIAQALEAQLDRHS